MSKMDIDEEKLNHQIRRFLKLVGITSQHEMEKAAKDAAAAGTFPKSGKIPATVTLSVPALNLEHVIEHEMDVGK